MQDMTINRNDNPQYYISHWLIYKACSYVVSWVTVLSPCNQIYVFPNNISRIKWNILWSKHAASDTLEYVYLCVNYFAVIKH